jgi:hypothetical protein
MSLRLLSLRVVAGVFVVLGLIIANVSLIIPLLSVVPVSKLVSIVGTPTDITAHDLKLSMVPAGASGILAIALLACVAAQLFRPAKQVAALWLLSFTLIVQFAYDASRLTVDSVEWAVFYSLFALVVLLHPRRFAPVGAIRQPAAVLAALAAIPLGWFAVAQVRLQFEHHDPQLDDKWDNLYFGMALFALVLIVAALLGSTSLPGRRLPAWLAFIGVAQLGGASLANPHAISALPMPWAIAAIVWSVAYLWVARPWGRVDRVPVTVITTADAEQAHV